MRLAKEAPRPLVMKHSARWVADVEGLAEGERLGGEPFTVGSGCR